MNPDVYKRQVFKYAVANMADVCEAVMERNHLTKEDIDWVIPHQANMRKMCIRDRDVDSVI